MTAAIPVIVNCRAGAASTIGTALRDRIEAVFAGAGLTASIALIDGDGLAQAMALASAAPLVVVGGGDGTLGTALGAWRGAGAIGILPLGTRNHLARDLAIPLDPAAAVRVIAVGTTRAIDLAAVNGRRFVNNASIGLYPLMVRHRDAGALVRLPRWAATIPAAWSALRRLRQHRLHFQTDLAPDHDVRTPLLFVGNNIYPLDRGRLGRRLALDAGILSVYAVAARSRSGLIWFALRALAGRTDQPRDFAFVGACAGLTVRSRARTIDVALDGEVHRLVSPLRFATLPGAVRVCVPAG